MPSDSYTTREHKLESALREADVIDDRVRDIRRRESIPVDMTVVSLSEYKRLEECMKNPARPTQAVMEGAELLRSLRRLCGVQKPMTDSNTTKPMTERERIALFDIKTWNGHPYTWKQSSMRKLEARGLVRAVGMRADQTMWELTDEGKAHP